MTQQPCVSPNDGPKSSSAWAAMGEIKALQGLDYRTVKPLRIYKFNPKYFLTMG